MTVNIVSLIIINDTMTDYSQVISLVDEIDWLRVNKKRGGVILVTVRPDDTIIYGMAIDRKSGEITDFGGGIEKCDRDCVDCAIRECSEETLRLLNINRRDVKKSLVIVGVDMIFLFYRIDWRRYIRLTENFCRRVKGNPHSENIRLVGYTSKEMITLIKGGTVKNRYMYNKVSKELLDTFPILELELNSIN